MTLARIAEFCGGQLSASAERETMWEPGAVCFDTRRLVPGQIFVALRGSRDGHEFLLDAAARGALGAIVEGDRSLGSLPHRFPVIRVPDTLAALQRWAASHRLLMQATVIAVTGSSGKTTTKDRLAAILSEIGPTHHTEGNLNNQIGVPLTLLALRPEHRWGVIEIAMNHPGEIEILARMVRPDHVVITTIGWAHIGAFGTREAILTEKLSSVAGLAPGGILFHADDPWLIDHLPAHARDLRRLTFSLTGPADFQPESVEWDLHETRFESGYTGKVRYPCPGRGALHSAAAACLVARTLGVDGLITRGALEAARPRPLRMEPRPLGPAVALLDCYNASPESSLEAVEFLLTVPCAGNRYLAFGEMRELGDCAAVAHQLLGTHAAPLDGAFFLGEGCVPALEAFQTGGGAGRPGRLYQDVEELSLDLARVIGPGDAVLFKGSRATAMERSYEACLRALAER